MQTFVRWYFKALELVMVLCLAAMCAMVFGNVVLRHVFDAGINTSEELSRFMFIWLTFLGAIVAMREGGHLGMDMVVSRLQGKARQVCLLLSQVLVLGCCGVMLWGLLLQYEVHIANVGMVTGLPLVIVYSVAYLCAASIGLMAVTNILTLLRGGNLAHTESPAGDRGAP